MLISEIHKELIAKNPQKYGAKDIKLKEESFNLEYYCAFFMYLITEYKTNDIYIPKICKTLGANYLLSKDDFANWFLDNYEKDEDNCEMQSVISIKDIHLNYMNMNERLLSKADIRKMTMANFTDKIKAHMLLKECFRDRTAPINGKQLTKQSIVGYRLKIETDDD